MVYCSANCKQLGFKDKQHIKNLYKQESNFGGFGLNESDKKSSVGISNTAFS